MHMAVAAGAHARAQGSPHIYCAHTFLPTGLRDVEVQSHHPVYSIHAAVRMCECLRT